MGVSGSWRESRARTNTKDTTRHATADFVCARAPTHQGPDPTRLDTKDLTRAHTKDPTRHATADQSTHATRHQGMCVHTLRPTCSHTPRPTRHTPSGYVCRQCVDTPRPTRHTPDRRDTRPTRHTPGPPVYIRQGRRGTCQAHPRTYAKAHVTHARPTQTPTISLSPHTVLFSFTFPRGWDGERRLDTR